MDSLKRQLRRLEVRLLCRFLSNDECSKLTTLLQNAVPKRTWRFVRHYHGIVVLGKAKNERS